MPVMRTRGTITSPAVSSPNSKSSCSTWLESARSAPCSSDLLDDELQLLGRVVLIGVLLLVADAERPQNAGWRSR